MIGYIYIVTNLVNGKKYIGRKTSPVFLGKEYMGSGVHVQRAIAKYGKDNFTVELIEECETSTQLLIHEYLWIKKLNAVLDDMYYNHSPGGLHEGWVSGDYNISKTPYMRKLNSIKHTGKTYSNDVVQKRENTSLERHGVKYFLNLEKRDKTSLERFGETNYSKTNQFKDEQSKRTTLYNLTVKDYKTEAMKAKGKKMMFKGDTQTWVFLPKQEEYLANGWKFGSCKKRKKKQSKFND